MKRIESFEGLRFIMVMLIVISHQSFLGEICPINSFFPRYYSFAVLGVDFFFLLSGFGMMLSSLNRVQTENMTFPTLKDNVVFGINHVRKIYPLYIVTIMVGLVFCITISILNKESVSTIILNNIIKLALVVPLLQSATGTMTFGHAYNGVGWFLSTLFCIYLFSPWLIYWLRRYTYSRMAALVFLIVDLFFVVFLAFIFESVEDYSQKVGLLLPIDQLVYISPYRRVFYVLTGMELAIIYNQNQGYCIHLVIKKPTIWEVISFFVAILYFVLRSELVVQFGSFVWGIDLLVCTCIMVVFSYSGGGVSAFLSTRSMQKLGQLSMYIFLIHYPIKTIGNYFVVNTLGGWTITKAIFFIVIEFATTYYISVFLHEKDLRRSVRSLIK